MSRVVSFYEKLPRGPAPAPQPKGLIERYQAKHFGKNPTAKRKNSLQEVFEEEELTLNSAHPPDWRSAPAWIRAELLLPPA